jgi:hypothetical protein
MMFFVTENGTMSESPSRCGPPQTSKTSSPSWYAAAWNE